MTHACETLYAGLTDRHILIVGGSSGVGLGAANLFSGLGARVSIAGRSAKRLEQAAASLQGAVATAVVDATSEDSIAQMFAALGPLDDLVVTLAGKLGAGPFATTPLSETRRAFDEKFWAHLSLAQRALPTLAADGSITLVTGASSRRASCPGGAGYAAMNGALDKLVPTLARELGPVRVNAVSPGLINTPWHSGMSEDRRLSLFATEAAKLPVGRTGLASDVAQAILLSVANGFVTGSVIECDGGVRV